MKPCTKCKINKKLEDFYKDKRAKDGRQSQCANCSDLYRSPIKKFLIQYKTNNPCKDCNKYYHFCIMDFDHIGPKRFMVSQSSLSMEDILVEMKNCELVCSNCHRVRTDIRRKEKKRK